MRPIVYHRSSDKDPYPFPELEVYFKEDRSSRRPMRIRELSSFTHFTEVLSTLYTFSGRNSSMSSDFFLPFQAIEDHDIPLQSPQLHTKATTAILGVSAIILAHGQSTSNASNYGDITHLSGARYYHLQTLEIHNLR